VGKRKPANPLPLLVQLSSEGACQAVRQGCSFAKKQESPLRPWSSSNLRDPARVSSESPAAAALGPFLVALTRRSPRHATPAKRLLA
jgi:hypothetical protein